jgi:hypothetical protein
MVDVQRYRARDTAGPAGAAAAIEAGIQVPRANEFPARLTGQA